MGCDKCGSKKSKSTVSRSVSIMADDLVRMEYTGVNRGPIPFKGVSGATYYGSSVTYRFVDVLPEDVNGLLRSGKFVKVARAETVETVSNVPVVPEADQSAGLPVAEVADQVETVTEFMDDALTVDLSTVVSVRESLKVEIPIENLVSAFNQEDLSTDPRKTVLDLLKNAIENHPDYLGSI